MSVQMVVANHIHHGSHRMPYCNVAFLSEGDFDNCPRASIALYPNP